VKELLYVPLVVEVVLGGGSEKESTAEMTVATEGRLRRGSAQEEVVVVVLLRMFGVAFCS